MYMVLTNPNCSRQVQGRSGVPRVWQSALLPPTARMKIHLGDGFTLKGHPCSHTPETGYYLRAYAGFTADEQRRLASASGGIISWLASRMLSTGVVEAVACVGPGKRPDRLFEFRLVTSVPELYECTKSRYYPVEVSELMSRIREFPGTVLFIGLPCFVKALRLAVRADETLQRKVKYTIGLVCGHLKSKHYAAYLSRICGVNERDVVTVDFRKKILQRPASQYAFEVSYRSNDGVESCHVMMKDVFAGSWTNNLFMLDACEYCDDVFAETADIAVGDAWLPEYVRDCRGTSIVVCRDEAIQGLLVTGVEEGSICLDNIPIERAIESQAAGLRQRRMGLAYRLFLSAKRGYWRPDKEGGA